MSIDKQNTFKKLIDKQDFTKKHFSVCPDIFDRLCIFWNGDIVPCCNDYEGDMLIGNIKDKSLHELWNDTKLEAYRKILSKCEYDKIELCKTCYDYMDIHS